MEKEKASINKISIKNSNEKESISSNTEKQAEKSKNHFTNFRENPWMISTLVLAVILIVFVFFATTKGITGNAVSETVAAENLVSFIKSQSQGQIIDNINVISTEKEGSLYKVTLDYQGQEIPVYVSLDGNYLITNVIPLDPSLLPNSQQDQQNDIKPLTINIADSPSKGEASAPVTIVEFSDYQCPFCARFFTETLPLIEKNYIDTGKVRLVHKDFPLSNIHPEAQKAAEAARCVREQKGDEAYFKMHDLLFENQQSLSIENYKKWARTLGVVGTKFDNCLEDGKYSSAVNDDLEYGQQLGVQGTPAFFINGKLVSGAQPYSVFEQIIDAELSGTATSS